MTKNDALVKEYADKIRPLLDLATKAYGSRSTDSPQHEASREYTRLLVEFHGRGGSLLDLAKAIDKTYAGLRRRVKTKDLEPSSKRPRKKFSEEQINRAVEDILRAKASGATENYHDKLREYYDQGYSLSKIAKTMGISSANPLYYGVNESKMRK